MKIFAKTVSLLYFFGAFLHFADICDLRLKFSEMNGIWKSWIIYLMIFDLIAGIGLWKNRKWGFVFFLIVASTQLIAYTFFQDFFGEQLPLVAFHCGTLCVFVLLLTAKRAGYVNGVQNAK